MNEPFDVTPPPRASESFVKDASTGLRPDAYANRCPSVERFMGKYDADDFVIMCVVPSGIGSLDDTVFSCAFFFCCATTLAGGGPGGGGGFAAPRGEAA